MPGRRRTAPFLLRRGRPTRLAVLVAVLVGAGLPGPASSAATWPVTTGTAQGLAQAAGILGVPGSVSAACQGLLLNAILIVSWSPVPHAGAYTVYQSPSATGPFVSVASVSTTSWTSAALPTGQYWYEVAATAGASWSSAASGPAGPRTITLALLCT